MMMLCGVKAMCLCPCGERGISAENAFDIVLSPLGLSRSAAPARLAHFARARDEANVRHAVVAAKLHVQDALASLLSSLRRTKLCFSISDKTVNAEGPISAPAHTRGIAESEPSTILVRAHTYPECRRA